MPTAIIGRWFGLPIETGKPAFLLYEFTPFGYILTIAFWSLLGGMVGWLIDSKNSAPPQDRG